MRSRVSFQGIVSLIMTAMQVLFDYSVKEKFDWVVNPMNLIRWLGLSFRK